MNILMHCIYFPPEVGGLESHVFHLCAGMARRGHRVRVVTSRSQPDLRRHEVVEDVEVWRTWLPARNVTGWTIHGVGSIPRLTSLARSADVLHAQAFQSVLPAAIGKRISGAPLVTTWHTSHFLRRARSPFWRPVLRRFVRWSDHNLAASREIAGVAESLVPGRAVEALTNGVDTELFRPVAPTLEPGVRRRIIVPRRLFAKNGVEVLLRAFPRILKAVDAEAVIVGDGPERARLETLARELGVSDRILWLGARPHEEMPGLLASAELAVFPSLMEATSVAALECMACELPVAASDVGGLPEIVDEEVGTLFRPGDPGDLTLAVIRLLGSDGLEARGRRARQRVVERWSNDRLVDRHLQIYRSLREGSAP